ncbi:hypothetical protein ACJX0J_016646, partial [Zea mays]
KAYIVLIYLFNGLVVYNILDAVGLIVVRSGNKVLFYKTAQLAAAGGPFLGRSGEDWASLKKQEIAMGQIIFPSLSALLM